MGLASISVDSVPSKDYTPLEPLVELLRICLEKNCVPFLAEAKDKGFLVTWLIKEWSRQTKSSHLIMLLIVHSEERARLWIKFLSRLTNLGPKLAAECDKLHGLIIATPQDLDDKNSLLLSNLGLVIVDNGHSLMLNKSVVKIVESNPKRVVTFVANLLRDEKHDKLLQPTYLTHMMHQRLKTYHGEPEACCDILSMLRFFCNPTLQIIEYITKSSNPTKIQQQVAKIVKDCYAFFHKHHYSLLEIYGAEFLDLIEDVPDPTTLPISLLDDFVLVMKTCGLWCAERAALLLIIKIDKLKTREKYERHFLLLSVLYTEMVKIRKLCEETFEEISDIDRLIRYSSPKLLRLVDTLRQYKPEHVCRPKPVAKPTTIIPENVVEEVVVEKNSNPTPRGRGGRSRGYTSYDDPNSLCGLVFVTNKFLAKLLYHFLKDLSRSDDAYSFLMPQYATDYDELDQLDAASFDFEVERKKQEDSLRRFRMKECNILISNSLLEVGIDGVRCNLVVAFDPPKTFAQYANCKVKAKAPRSHFLIFGPEGNLSEVKKYLAKFTAIEETLKAHCTLPGIALSNPDLETSTSTAAENDTEHRVNPYHSLNRYCAKLPSDTL
jgi:endoribonuclease Dicer